MHQVIRGDGVLDWGYWLDSPVAEVVTETNGDTSSA